MTDTSVIQKLYHPSMATTEEVEKEIMRVLAEEPLDPHKHTYVCPDNAEKGLHAGICSQLAYDAFINLWHMCRERLDKENREWVKIHAPECL